MEFLHPSSAGIHTDCYLICNDVSLSLAELQVWMVETAAFEVCSCELGTG